jgi:signal transduction histidine kinase
MKEPTSGSTTNLPSLIGRLRWHGEDPVDPQSVNPVVMARAFAYLYGAGATLVLLTLALPASDRFIPGLVAPPIIAYGVVLLMLIGFDRLPLWLFRLLPGFGSVLISVIAYSGGPDTIVAYAMLYFWVVLSAFYFFDGREAAPTLVLVAVSYATVMLIRGDVSTPVLKWLMVVTTLGVAALLLSLLRGRIELLFSELRDSDLLKTTLLRSVSHDLRSPLTAIAAAGESIASPTLDEEGRRELSSVIVSEASRLSDMIDKLLDLSRLQAGLTKPRRTWCSLEEVVEAALDHLTHGQDGFELELDPDVPNVWADAAQLERAFVNLLENSSRYAGEAPVLVSVNAAPESVVLRVADRGPGIDAALRARIFEPFYRGDGKTSQHRGSGLGLAIVKGFIEANGGRVSVESRLGQGTTFVVELPLADAGPRGLGYFGTAPLG